MVAPVLTAELFRSDFPVFADTEKYQDTAVNFWIGIADQLLNTPYAARKWGANLKIGEEYFVAHSLIIEEQNKRTVDNGGVPGLNTGAISGKSVDKVSISYDSGAGLELGAGHWNLTVYGTRFIQLARMTGSGGLQLGVGCDSNNNGFGWSQW